MRSVIVSVADDGKARYLDKKGFSIPGNVETRRASHIHPVGLWARQWFRMIRWWYGDESEAAEATRHWKVFWRVDLRLSGGGIEGPFMSRSDAVDFEEGWLASRGFPGS